MALWAALLIAVLNFTPSLFKQTPLELEPLWTRAVKDVALALVLSAGAATGLLRARGAGASWPRPSDWRRLLAATRRTTGSSPSAIYSAPFLLLVAWIAIDAVVRTPQPAEFLVSVRYYLLYPLLVVAVAALRLDATVVRRIFTALAIVGAIEGLIALVEFFGYVEPTYYGGYISIGGELYPRTIGTLGNPNNLAIFLALAAILVLSGATGSGWWRWPVLALILTGLAFTFSKAAGVALLASAVVLETGRPAQGRLLRAGVVGVVGLALSVWAVRQRFGGELSGFSIFGGRGDAFEAGFERWTADVSTFVFGEGFGSQVDVSGGGITQKVTDNMPLTLALEGGLIGLVLFAAVVCLTLRTVVRARRARPSPAQSVILAYLVFFLLYSPFVINFRLFPGAMFFWVFAGVAVGLAAQRGDSRSSSYSSP